jgi:hypothetical protein
MISRHFGVVVFDVFEIRARDTVVNPELKDELPDL